MSYTLILHLVNEEPVVGEVEELPSPTDNMIALRHPRRLDGKELPNLADDVMLVYWMINRLHYVEVVSGRDEEEIIGFVRE